MKVASAYWFIALAVLAALSSPASAETVSVKWAGPIDISDFKCNDVTGDKFVRRICYDEPTQHLVLLLKETYYHFCDVSSGTIATMRSAAFPGDTFNAEIRGKHRCKRAAAPQPPPAP